MLKKVNNYFLCFFLLVSQLTLSQVSNKVLVDGSNFQILLKNTVYEYHDKQVGQFTVRDYILSADESLPGKYKLPSTDLIIALPQGSKPKIDLVSSVANKNNVIPSFNPAPEMINDSTIFSKSVMEGSNENGKMPQLIEVKGYLWIRDFYCVHVRINSHQFDEATNQLIEYSNIVINIKFTEQAQILAQSPVVIRTPFDESIKLVLANADIAEQFRAKPANYNSDDTSGKWINYSSDYLKIGIASDGIFRVSKSDFEKCGINSSFINPKTFQLFESGKEKPIYVSGELDLSFDAIDFIEFYGTKNYSKISPRVINKNDEEYIELLNRLTDTTYYFLTWGSQDGIRVQQKTGNTLAATDTLNYYDEFIHLEDNPIDALFYTFSESLVRNQFPFWETSKAWYWRWLASWSSSISQNFQVTNLYENKQASIFAKVASFGSNQQSKPHYIRFNLNSQKIDSVYLDRFGRKLLTGKTTTLLKNGTNTFNLTYKENNGSTSGTCLLDWLEVEYPRKLELQNDSLSFALRSELPNQVRVIKIGKATNTSYSIYRVKPEFFKVVDYQIVGGNLLFKDSVGTGYEYSIASEKKYLKPATISKKVFSNLRKQLVATDYLAISHPNFKKSVNKYISEISSAMNLKTSAYYVNDIYDEFGYGYPTPESIKGFVKYVLMNSPSPLPSFLTLIGDANYDYKGVRKKQAGIRIGENYVPSYGFPVSDPWYVIFDSLNVSLPQMFIGRIPINNELELDIYSSKIQKNILSQYDDWNKKFLFFSGGSGSQAELDNLKNVQQRVIDQLIKPAPLAGISDHFYKIKGNDFGPFTQEYVNNAINQGAIFISYLGHSGTSTWDNSISDVSQLKNKRDRNYVVADFGCSTNKFAEPDITCFGERFVISKEGQALGYLGNSALGFTSLAYTAPNLLFESIVTDKAKTVGQIHWLTKYKMFSQFGNSETSRLFNYSNTLLGDPAVELKVPSKPNLFISEEKVSIGDNNIILDSQDSVSVRINLNNYGITQNQKITIRITHSYNQKNINEKDRTIFLPNYQDSISLKLHVKNMPGLHTIRIELDSKNEITEIYETDNIITTNFYVAANQFRDLLVNQTSSGKITSLNILSPQQKPLLTPKLLLRTSNNSNFSNYQQKEIILNDFYTRIIFSENDSLRHWFKYGFALQDTVWSKEKSYSNKMIDKISLNDKYAYSTLKYKKLDYSNAGIGFKKDTLNISVISAGQFAGQTCIISLNGKNLLENTFFLGIGICVFNPTTFEVEEAKWYELFNNPSNHNKFETFVKSIPNGKIIALGISGDAVNNNSGQFRNVLKYLGSTKADSILFKGSWAFIGVKGGDPKNNIEVVRNPYAGLVTINKNYVLKQSSGSLETETYGPTQRWQKLSLNTSGNSDINYNVVPIGFVNSFSVGDTLTSIKLSKDVVDLSNIIPQKYSYLKFILNMADNSGTGNGLLKSFNLDFNSVPELGINYQVVSVAKDTVEQGENINMSFRVYNVGESRAENFKVNVELVRKDNSRENIFEQIVDSVGTEKYKQFNLSYNTASITGSIALNINIDSENKITELYKDNNFYSVPIYIKPNTKPASIKLTFDGNDIMDGDYVSPNPNIRVELNDQSLIPIQDTLAVQLFLNNKRIYFSNNSNLTYSFGTTNPKYVVDYKPKLENATYSLKVLGKNATGQLIDSTGLIKKFSVKKELQLLDVYNYPNPMVDGTYFTFKLTQIPDELKLKIYTLTGRMIKEFYLTSSELKYDFNNIFWDSKDTDGDLVANGVYLYKVISKKGSEISQMTQKLAIVR